MTKSKRTRRMYAVSAKGYGILEGTLAYTRRGAIFLCQSRASVGSFLLDWNAAKCVGYRTVCVAVEVRDKWGVRRSTRR